MQSQVKRQQFPFSFVLDAPWTELPAVAENEVSVRFKPSTMNSEMLTLLRLSSPVKSRSRFIGNSSPSASQAGWDRLPSSSRVVAHTYVSRMASQACNQSFLFQQPQGLRMQGW